PAANAPDEVFLFHGRGRHGARLVSFPLGFERLDEELWTWFAGKLLDGTQGALDTSLGERPPYLGLASFSTDDAAAFVGRERQVVEFVNRLRATPLLAVVGPSGAGKSSFVQAGVIPALVDSPGPTWRILRVRPGPAPVAALEAVLAQAGLG